MSVAVDRVSILEKIRDHYNDIRMITMHCCSDISTEAIPDMIRQRNELFNLIASEENLLTSGEFDDLEASRTEIIKKEIRSIVETIMALDNQVEQVIRNHLQKIKSELASLNKTSRAATAYVLQSRV